MSKTQTPQVPDKKDAPAPDPFAHIGDPHWGKGGRYVVDPATGKRVPADPPPAAKKE